MAQPKLIHNLDRFWARLHPKVPNQPDISAIMTPNGSNTDFFLLLHAFLLLLPHPAATSPNSPSPSICTDSESWRVVWRDEFDSPSINISNWNIETLTAGSSSHGRDAAVFPQNVYLSNDNDQGVLVLRSLRTSTSTAPSWSTGAVDTRDKAFWMYGRFCISAKLPGGGSSISNPRSGLGIWPAHWMMPNDKSCWPDHGEIDIMEMVNGDGVLHGTYHFNPDTPDRTCTVVNLFSGGQIAVAGWDSEYHEYAAEWTPDSLIFYFDGKPYYSAFNQTFAQGVLPHKPPSPMYMIINTAIGGDWPHPPTNETISPTFHYIDYVRVSQRR